MARVERPGLARPAGPGGSPLRCAHELEKESLIESEPDVFFTTAHYDGYPLVLVRMGAIGLDQLETLLADAWYVRAPTRLRAAFETDRGP